MAHHDQFTAIAEARDASHVPSSAPSTSTDTILRLDDVDVTYPDGTVALRSASLALRCGEFTVLLGLSGAGKSTLLRTMNHLVAPSRGRVISSEFGSLQSRAALRRHRRRTAVVFQHHQLIERHTALQNVLVGRLAFHGALRTLFPLPRRDLQLAMSCLDRVGLADKALTRVDCLSGGQKQRVGIARALAQQPSLILADEPVASLDPETSAKVLGLLREICDQGGISVVVSLHQLEHARRFADRIVGIAEAEIVFNGSSDSLGAGHLARIYRQPLSHLAARQAGDDLLPSPPKREISA